MPEIPAASSSITFLTCCSVAYQLVLCLLLLSNSAQIIAQISKGTWLYPGDVIGSGTCATGCFYEINSAKNQSEQIWLQDGDSIDISANKIGILQNQIKVV